MPFAVAAPAHPPGGDPVYVALRLFAPPGAVRQDPFAQLVRHVADDVDNPYNLERYLWVLEEAPPEPCERCGDLFLPSFGHDGAPRSGRPRRYCSPACAKQALDERRPRRPVNRPGGLVGCHHCGVLFDPSRNHAGGPASGAPRRHCSVRCTRAGVEARRAERRRTQPAPVAA